MSLLFEPVTDLRQQYTYLTTLLWRNNFRIATFTKVRTPDTDKYEWYWYSIDNKSRKRIERLYYATKEGIYIILEEFTYRVQSMENYLLSPDIQIMLKLQNTVIPTDYIDFIGDPFPEEVSVSKQVTAAPQKSRKNTVPENPIVRARREQKRKG